MADQMQPTPRSTILGLFSDIVNLPLQYMSSPERTQQMQGTAQFLYETGIPKTLERLSYGDSLFSGAGMTLRPREETINAAMAVAPLIPTAGRVIPKVVRATEGLPVGMSIKDVSYRGSHTAPSSEFGAPLYDLSQMYPADVYSAKAAQYYGSGNKRADIEAFNLAKRVRGNPDAEVTIYRAVPKNADISNINAGDWVTLTKDYAKGHGESVLRGDYKILSQKVKAKELWTNADSIQEFGYQPQQLNAPQQAALPVGATGLPSPQSLTMPSVPTVEQMGKYGRTEVVPLSQAVSFQSARNWENFNAGKHPGDLVAGYGDKPLALRLETGEYVIYDGNHRTDLALQKGQTELPMYVIDVKSYDPTHAGRKPVPPSMTDDELLSSLLGDEVPVPQQAATPIENPTFTDPFGNTIGSSIR